MGWVWPLAEMPRMWPDEKGVFGAVRKHDVHTGIDLYTSHGKSVTAVEDGVVVAFEDYTGAKADSPWWNDTEAIFVKGASGVICYGEIEINSNLNVGDMVAQGEHLGKVLTVLKKDKGRPMTMLHFELYTPETTESVIWTEAEGMPDNLLDPTEKLWDVFQKLGGTEIYKED